MNMNRLFIVAMLVLVPALLSAQRAMITFRFAMEQSGSQLSADSIFVENLSSNCDTMLYAPTVSLKVVVLAGIDEAKDEDEKFGIESWY